MDENLTKEDLPPDVDAVAAVADRGSATPATIAAETAATTPI